MNAWTSDPPPMGDRENWFWVSTQAGAIQPCWISRGMLQLFGSPAHAPISLEEACQDGFLRFWTKPIPRPEEYLEGVCVHPFDALENCSVSEPYNGKLKVDMTCGICGLGLGFGDIEDAQHR